MFNTKLTPTVLLICIICLALSMKLIFVSKRLTEIEIKMDELEQAVIWNQSLIQCFSGSPGSDCAKGENH